MPRKNASNWSNGDSVTPERLQNTLEDIDDLYLEGTDHGRVVLAASETALKVDIGSGSFRIGDTNGTYVGGTDVTVTDDASNYIMLDEFGAIQISTSAWNADHARLALVVASSGSISSITDARQNIIGGDLSNSKDLVNVETLSADKTLTNANKTVQILDPDDANRDVTLETTSVLQGTKFYIHNSGGGGNLVIKQSSTEILSLYPDQSAIFSFDGTNWKIINKVLDAKFGDGRHGVLNVTSGTTTIDCDNESIVIRQYTSFTIASGATLDFSNVPDEGIVFIPLIQGNFDVAGTIDLSECGSAGGTLEYIARSSNLSVSGDKATDPINHFDEARHGGGGGAGIQGGSAGSQYGSNAAGTGAGSSGNQWTDGVGAATGVTMNYGDTINGGSNGNQQSQQVNALISSIKYGIKMSCGAGGSTGGIALKNVNSTGSVTLTAGNGGRGGGSFMPVVGGNWDFTGVINLSGSNAASPSITSNTLSASGNASYAIGIGGSSGGSSGLGFGLYGGTLVADSGTYTMNGGTSSNGTSTHASSGSNAVNTSGYSTNGKNGSSGKFLLAKAFA